MAERSNAADSKSVFRLAGTGVRIPLSPLNKKEAVMITASIFKFHFEDYLSILNRLE